MTTTIPPLGSKVVKIRFNPSAEGKREGSISFVSNVEGSPHVIPLSGTGKITVDPPTPIPTMTYLSSVGSSLHDEAGAGKKVVLRSINWYGFEQIFAPTGVWTRPIRTKAVDGVVHEGMLDEIKRLGFNSLRLLFSQDITWPGAKPETRMGYWNTTFIHPGFNPEFLNDLVDDNPQNTKTTIEILDQFVTWCEELEIRIVFDMHALAPDNDNVLATNGKWYSTVTPTAAGATTGARREPRNEAQAIAAHVFLANRYKNRPVVCGFDLINEPHACTWDRDPLTGIVGFYERASAAIHAVNPDVLIVCEGITGNLDFTPEGHEDDPESQQGLYTWSTWWSGKLDDVRNTPIQMTVPNKLVYSPHEYGAYLLGVTTQPWFNPEERVGAGYAGLPYPQNMDDVWRRQWGFLAEEGIAPVWIGEFGSYLRIGGNPITGGGSTYNAQHLALDEKWLTSLSNYCNRYDIGFAYWAWPPGGDPDGLVDQNSKGEWTKAQQFKVNYLSPFLVPVVQPHITVTPGSATFTQVVVGTPVTTRLQLRNAGATAVPVSVAATGSGYSVSPTTGSVPASGVLELVVNFAPQAAGNFSGSVTVTYGNGLVLTIPLTGSAVQEEVPGGTPIVIDLPATAWGITAVGDSLTEGGLYFHNGWLTKACFLGNQRLRERPHFAVSGSTVEQADTLQLPKVLAMSPPPKVCVVATGTNSIYQGVAGVARVKEICQKLIAAKIYPILWTLPPRNDTATMDSNMVAWNNAIRDYHVETGIPLLDAFEAMRVPDSMRARADLMNPDGLHFSNYGYTVLGRYAVTSKAFVAVPTDGTIPLATAAGAPNLIPNPLFSGSGNVATGFQLGTGFTGQLLPAPVGNWQRIVRPAGMTSGLVSSTLELIPTPVNKKVSLACKVRWNTGGLKGGVDKVNAAWELGLQVMFTDQNWGNYNDSLFVVVGPQGDSEEEGTVYMQFTPPTGANRLMMQFFVNSADILAHTNNITYDVSQLTLIEGEFPFNQTDPSPT